MPNWNDLRGAVGRNTLPALLFRAWESDWFDSLDELAAGIEEAWTSAEFPEQSISTLDWLNLFDAVGYLDDGRRAANFDQSITLYRGAIPERRWGMSWTLDLERARWFAGRFGEGGYIWKARAQPTIVLARFHQSRLEDEFVLDTSRLRVSRVIT